MRRRHRPRSAKGSLLPSGVWVHILGPVFLIPDINGARNVSGVGINQAERVMSCGDGGHILVSEGCRRTARHLSRWKDRIHDCWNVQSKGRNFAHMEPFVTAR